MNKVLHKLLDMHRQALADYVAANDVVWLRYYEGQKDALKAAIKVVENQLDGE